MKDLLWKKSTEGLFVLTFCKMLARMRIGISYVIMSDVKSHNGVQTNALISDSQEITKHENQ